MARLPPAQRTGYDTPDVADVSFDQMARIVPADYPVLFWLARMLVQECRVLDCGGHFGTKYIAFAPVLPVVEAVDWVVQDLPSIVSAARAAQGQGRIPARLRFVESAAGMAPDLLLASGLLQYFDRSLSDLVADLVAPPRHILLNKVATRAGDEIVTLERIGPARVPYRVRNQQQFEREVERLGYAIRDAWSLPGLSHVIPTHPWLGPSVSRGYFLERAQPGPE